MRELNVVNLMPGNNNGVVQLLSGSRRRLDVSVPGENRPIFAGVVFLVLAALSFGGLSFYLSNLRDRLSALDSEFNLQEDKRDQKKELEILTWNKKLSLAGDLIGNHIVWSRAMQKIHDLTPPQVQFSSFRAELQEGKIEIESAAPSYTVIAKAIAALSGDPVFTDVSLNKISGLSSGLLEYDLRVDFAKDKLLLNAVNSQSGGN